MSWPKQSQCDAFYGNPRNKADPTKASQVWEAANIVYVKTPFVMRYDGVALKKGMRVHRLVADSLTRVLDALWAASGRSQATIDDWGVSIFGGAFNYRLMRGGSSLSMHSWGCAIDLDPDRNGFHDPTPRFAQLPQVVRAFKDEGWVWGGDWSAKMRDGMHFQAATVG